MEEGRSRRFLVALGIVLMFFVPILQVPTVHGPTTTIVIDDLHSSTNANQLQNYLSARGYNVVMASATPEQSGSSTTRILASLDSTGATLMVVLYQPYYHTESPYSDQEVSQLESWVNSGGNILVVLAPSDGSCSYDIGQPNNLSVFVANSLGRSFGIEVTTAFAIKPDNQGMGINTNLTVSSTNPIFNDVHSLFFYAEDHFIAGVCDSYAGGALALQLSGNANEILTAGGNSIGAIDSAGAGKLVLTGFSVGENAGSGGVIWSGADNDVFIANLFRYLAPIGSSGPIISQSTTNLTNSKNSAQVMLPSVSFDALVIAVAVVIAGVAIGMGLSRRKAPEKSEPSRD